MIELGMVVDTTVHNSNKQATFGKYCNCHELQSTVPVARPSVVARNGTLRALAHSHLGLHTGKTASFPRQQEARP